MDFYEYLGIKPTATPDEIKNAFRKKAKKIHPDYNQKNTAFYEMVELNIAYETLINPKKRAEYDAIRNQEQTERAILKDNRKIQKTSLLKFLHNIFIYKCKVCGHELPSTWKGYCLYHYLEATNQLDNEDFIFTYNNQIYQWENPPEHLKQKNYQKEKNIKQYKPTKIQYALFLLLMLVIMSVTYAIFLKITNLVWNEVFLDLNKQAQ